LRVAVSAAGRLSVSGKTIRSRRRVLFGPAEVDLPLRLNRTGRRRLQMGPKRAIVAKVAVVLAPFDGTPAVRLHRTVSFAWKGGKR